MTEHHTRNTVEAESWCARCQRSTPHNVYGRRIAGCKRCIDRLDAEAAERKKRSSENPPAEQLVLLSVHDQQQRVDHK